MSHLIKMAGTGAIHRTHEQKIETLADIREFVAHLQVALLRANRNGQELFVEVWEDYYQPREGVINSQGNGLLAKS